MLKFFEILYGILLAIFSITYVIIIVIHRRKLKGFILPTIVNGIANIIYLVPFISLSICSIRPWTYDGLLIFFIFTSTSYILLIRDYYPIFKGSTNNIERITENLFLRAAIAIGIMVLHGIIILF